MAEPVKYSVEIVQDDDEFLVVSIFEHRKFMDNASTIELLTSTRERSISDAMFMAGHEIAIYLGNEWY